MQAQEFRIGNFIHPCSIPKHSLDPSITLTGIVIRVETISAGEISVSTSPIHKLDFKPWQSEYQHYRFNRVSPIPLTPEWMERFGFASSNQKPYNDQPSYIIGEDANRIIWSGESIFKPLPESYLRVTTTPIKYVHQLQNILFALTGEEFILKK